MLGLWQQLPVLGSSTVVEAKIIGVRVEPIGELKWTDNENLQVGDATFFLTIDPDVMTSSKSDSNQFLLAKRKSMVESLIEKAPGRIDNIFDLGIFKGGSVALYNELFRPRRLVGIELSHYRVTALDEFIAQHSLGEIIHLYYGTLQHDRERLTSIVRDEFGDERLDLVVDDCSHKYEQTKATLNVLFPRLRPGGLYLIEDWGSSHWPADHWQGRSNKYAKEQNPLSRLILELVMVSASRPGLVQRVDIDGSTAYVTRGDEPVSDTDFDISKSYLTAGRKILNKRTRLGVPTGQQVRNFVHHHSPRRPTT
jgi:predicted O-methyltransferase YrrM